MLTFESIVKGCYANPERGKYQKVPGIRNYVYSSKTLEQILNHPPKTAITKLNQKKWRFFDDSNVLQKHKSNYVSKLKTCMWYGPFEWTGEIDYIFFTTITDSGENYGYYFGVHPGGIWLNQIKQGWS